MCFGVPASSIHYKNIFSIERGLRMKKRIIGILGTALVATMAFGVPVFAKSYSSDGYSFSSSWEAADSGSGWVIKYGFNTAMINEDYTHTRHDSLHHTASVSNANGTFADEDKAGQWAGIEVMHSGSTVNYGINW